MTLTVLWAVATAVLLGLGTWQLQRLAWKNELIAKAAAAAAAAPIPLPAAVVDPAALEFRRVRLSGAYLSGKNLAMGLLTRDGRSGSRLLAPFRLEDGRIVLVDRGFVAEARLREALAAAPPAGPRLLEGIVRTPGAASWATPAPDLSLPRWYAPDLAAIGRALGLVLEPFLVILERREADAEPLAEPAAVAVDLPNPHLGYALTWFGLAAALLVFYILLGMRAGREQAT